MSVQTSENLDEFIEYFKANEDYIDFNVKDLWNRMILRGFTPDGFKFKITEYADHTQVCVQWGVGQDMVVKATTLDRNMTYRCYRTHDAVDKLEELLDSGRLNALNSKLSLCVNALLGIVDDGVLAELYFSITEKDDKITGIYASAFNETIVIDY